MSLRTRIGAAVAAVLLLVAGCGGPAGTGAPSTSLTAKPSVFPVIISGELIPGPNRLVFSFLDGTGTKPVGAPDRTASIQFVGPAGETVGPVTGTFIWAIENVNGVYVTHVDFPVAGAWTAQFTTEAPGSPKETIPFGFDVRTDASVVEPGEKAPSVDTPTLDDVGGDVTKISTDAKPVPAFYRTSVAAALAAHEPFVLVFATPKFCKTLTCGPTLEKVKTVAAAHPDVTFINVEPYQLQLVDGQLQPVLDAQGYLQSVPATTAYGLLTEPFVFLVGSDGVVKSSFELVFTPDEINEALATLK
ncbi:MAG TPA: hypothetical protein VGQ64_13590 [Candidatus Limnocylindrales bacterium]|jgi:hypothetical protein|nr:hypothetical protein [Candidatus Limnocylindrales bacterium]